MAINHFIPTIWSENLIGALEKQYIGVANCNRDYEGDISKCGSVVKICGVGSITVGDYTKNTDMSNPQELSDQIRNLTINRAKYFNFQLDDIDKVQCTPKLMDAAMKKAAESLSNEADQYIYGMVANNSSFHVDVDPMEEGNILDAILEARQTLQQFGVSDFSSVVLEVSPAVATLLYKAKLNISTDNAESLENGYIGMICGCKTYVSNNIVQERSDDLPGYIHHCAMRTTRAITFADQLSEIDAYRPEKRFADAVKGLHLYGAAIVHPTELVSLRFAITKYDE